MNGQTWLSYQIHITIYVMAALIQLKISMIFPSDRLMANLWRIVTHGASQSPSMQKPAHHQAGNMRDFVALKSKTYACPAFHLAIFREFSKAIRFSHPRTLSTSVHRTIISSFWLLFWRDSPPPPTIHAGSCVLHCLKCIWVETRQNRTHLPPQLSCRIAPEPWSPYWREYL